MCVCVVYCAGNIHLGVRDRRIFVGTVGGAARGSVGVIVITPAISGPGNSLSVNSPVFGHQPPRESMFYSNICSV